MDSKLLNYSNYLKLFIDWMYIGPAAYLGPGGVRKLESYPTSSGKVLPFPSSYLVLTTFKHLMRKTHVKVHPLTVTGTLACQTPERHTRARWPGVAIRAVGLPFFLQCARP